MSNTTQSLELDDETKKFFSSQNTTRRVSYEESVKPCNVPVFYWRTDVGLRSLPKLGVTVGETKEFMIIRDNETEQEVACYKEDYEVSSELNNVYNIVASFIEANESQDCTVVFTDEKANELKDFLKIILTETTNQE